MTAHAHTMTAEQAEAYSIFQTHRAQQCLADRFFSELGRMIGTTKDPATWAAHFDCTYLEARATIRLLKDQRRCREVDGLLYSY